MPAELTIERLAPAPSVIVKVPLPIVITTSEPLKVAAVMDALPMLIESVPAT